MGLSQLVLESSLATNQPMGKKGLNRVSKRHLLTFYVLDRSKIRVLSTTGNPSLRENVANIFGAKSVTQLIPFEVNLSSVMDVDQEETGNR